MASSYHLRKTALIAGISIVTVALAAAVVVVLVLLVFSNDTNKARSLIGEAAPHMATVQQQIEGLAPQIDNLVRNTPDMGDEAEYQGAIAPVRAQVQAIDAELDAATISYEKVSRLQGVEEYKEYARVEMELVRNDHTLTAQVNTYLDDMLAAIRGAGAAYNMDSDSYYARSSEFITMFNGLRGDAAKLKDQAEKLPVAQ
ncbi:MAG: hypothetical protein ACYC99_13070 [Candidatus Geothermincolia bacterium]